MLSMLGGGCTYTENKDELAAWVKSSIEEHIAKDPDWAGLEVVEITLVRESLNKFNGLAEFRYDGETEYTNVIVTVDGDSKIYQCEPPRKLIIKRLATLGSSVN
ncbi:MAG: hypothetical protein A2Y12_09845 [Planctomycetes bacterium GWF2_42_9]|nr:MAG: hypothetical protein A2Y12_09845 [Planctomycetes bacterium GWF2_42_9]